MELSAKPRILAVDDEAMIRTVIQAILGRKQIEVVVAQNTTEASTLLQEQAFDVILLDVKLGSGSGLDLLKTLREEFKIVTPVLMMSGLADTERIKEASKYNIKGFIMKPFNAKSLEEKVCGCLPPGKLTA
jgi:DNA-binding response OmpR family regulator